MTSSFARWRSPTTDAALTAPEGNGLRGMRERLEAIGGSLQRQTAAGTRLVIHLPLAPMASALRN